MPTRDLFHSAVKNALVKDGWSITDDPLYLKVSVKIDVYIDLGAERMLAAEKGEEKIAVEVKSFAGKSALSEFHMALGQFLNYQNALKIKDAQRVLFLAVPLDTYESFFQDDFIAATVQQYGLRQLIYNVKTEEITKWIK